MVLNLLRYHQRNKLIYVLREREILMKVIFLKVYLGDSNRQPQPSHENLEWYLRPMGERAKKNMISGPSPLRSG